MKLPEIEGLKPCEGLGLSAVYFLCQGDEVVYVGKTGNLIQRLGCHKSTIKHDRSFYLPCASDDLAATESKFIKLLNPLFNRNGKTKEIDEELEQAKATMDRLQSEHEAESARFDEYEKEFRLHEERKCETWREYWKSRDAWKLLVARGKAKRKKARELKRKHKLNNP